MKKLLAGCLVAGMCFGAGASGTFAQDKDTPKEDAKKAGDAGKDAGKAAAEAGKAAGDAAKHAGKATGKAAKDGAKGVKNGVTGDVTVLCNDGKKHSGKTNEAACVDHGGVKK